MITIYVLRAFGGVLIISYTPPVLAAPVALQAIVPSNAIPAIIP